MRGGASRGLAAVPVDLRYNGGGCLRPARAMGAGFSIEACAARAGRMSEQQKISALFGWAPPDGLGDVVDETSMLGGDAAQADMGGRSSLQDVLVACLESSSTPRTSARP